MRVSADQTDPGYIDDFEVRRHFKVFLDGVEQKDVRTADEEEGFVIVLLRRGPKNDFYAVDGQAASERREGKVVIVNELESRAGIEPA